ncbi:conserved hypothetical protein [Rhodopseudomonas palustris HaA2]|uniref:DUF4167 domain-containing protein n=1 Tax=Rhodopseudomonas palustris (strain HaA2) TaxID=316058 RepID=Q2J427_RHOP2|nr:DUF4167 domain-containing protein [Rhodopseudomonas palustris]ABD04783.1 conserved hypothetical protein [Rhodopseudomonas palustris HaA2]
MRNGQNNKRLRNRNSGSNTNNNNNNRRGQNPMTRVFESNGPDIKIRGTASHVAEKYVQLARDARSSGDPVAAENYYQHAEHYFRLIAAAQEQFRQNQPQQAPRIDNDMSENDDDGESDYSNFGAEPGLVPVQQQPQSFQPREPREQPQFQPREPREQPQPREHRPQPQFTPRVEQPQPSVDAGVDRLPSFITGPQPQISPAAFEGATGGGGERFPPRRRRRPHAPRGDAAAAPVPAEDASPGNE